MEMDFGWNNDTLWALFWKTSACEYACDHVSDHVRVGGTRVTLKLDKILKKITVFRHWKAKSGLWFLRELNQTRWTHWFSGSMAGGTPRAQSKEEYPKQ